MLFKGLQICSFHIAFWWYLSNKCLYIKINVWSVHRAIQKSLFFSLNMQICDCLVAVVIARAAYSVIRSALPALTSGWCYFVLFPVQLLSGALYITCFSRCIFDDLSHLLQLFHRLAVLDSLKYKSSTIVVLHVIECTSLKATHIMPRRTLTCSSKGK